MDPYLQELEKHLSTLSFEKCLAFAFLTAEKLTPNYTYFSEKNNWGDSTVLYNCLTLIYESIFEASSFTKKTSKILYEDIERLTPDTEDFDTIFVSFALDACTALMSTLDFINEKNKASVIDVASYARDTVDLYIQEAFQLNSNDVNLEKAINDSVFMITEKNRQLNLLYQLRSIIKITKEDVSALRAIQPNPIINFSLLTD